MTYARIVWMAVPMVLVYCVPAMTETVTVQKHRDGQATIYRLSNDKLEVNLRFENGRLHSERVTAREDWLQRYGSRRMVVELDADFEIDVQWTGWRAPGKVHNADNPLRIRKSAFELTGEHIEQESGGAQRLILEGRVLNGAFEMRLVYRLAPGDFFARRKLAVRDPKARRHFLRWLWPRSGYLLGPLDILKSGGFGNPLAVLKDDGGAFFGLEYPAGTNHLTEKSEGKTRIRCGQEFGVLIDSTWIESEWAVTGLTPNRNVRLWFHRYLDDIRVAPLRPFLLYNTWYDVRSPEYTKRPEDVMNEAHLLRIIRDFRREMLEKRGLRLDAFVLDDGWDVYKSDWRLRPNEFPNGLGPIRESLAEMGTGLGIWFGPIGGYSYRRWRVDWMREHGYETVRDQLCLAGRNYHALFKKRVVDFVARDSVGYFKWDGIQFSCSEPDHGHPVGIYSRRAVMEAVIDLCRAVREENPDIFLNITSGTWLSPWWLKYANQIWMQGRDYGYANVPSISRRDAAMTYRDVVLYENFGKNDFWFPIANLMTHGIIKGYLQKLGGEQEPIKNFTDNAVLYFARGVSMWELYISPNLLTEAEWDAIAGAVRWARDRFDVLMNTAMIGGDPGKGEPYGYAHFRGRRGIIAVRNPGMQPQTLRVKLAPSQGLEPTAASLVLERVYPDRWISPELYAAGAEIDLPLAGYETAIYELFPLMEADRPLMAGVRFAVDSISGSRVTLRLFDETARARLLNPEKVRTLRLDGRSVALHKLSSEFPATEEPMEPIRVLEFSKERKSDRIQWRFQVEVEKEAVQPELAVLLRNGASGETRLLPELHVRKDGKTVKPALEQHDGVWLWAKVPLSRGKPRFDVRLQLADPSRTWSGTVEIWLLYRRKESYRRVNIDFTDQIQMPPMPPRPYPAGEVQQQQWLDAETIILRRR